MNKTDVTPLANKNCRLTIKGETHYVWIGHVSALYETTLCFFTWLGLTLTFHYDEIESIEVI